MALQTSFSPSSSSSCSFSSSSFSYAWKYHVFLSFRGPDTRHGFIGHLHKALSDKGIHTFIDDEELRRGEEITPSLAKAIEESRIAIPVFSENYASSAFCLDELVKIMECIKGKDRLVLPIFYDVEPSDVRHQRGSYGNALARHEERFKDDKERVQKWKKALRQAADLSGEHFKPGNEYECDFIEKIVKEISKRISRVPLHVADYPVGLESRVLEVNQLLNDGSDDGVHMVGIHGIGGIGKTTLAKAVYNSVADQFQSLCFIENMSELLDRHGLVHLQEMVLSKILGDKVCNLGSVGEGISIIKERLRCKKVLLVLDNVDEREQLQEIIGSLRELGSGSKVIITTRDKQLLRIHGVEKAYEVKVLNEEEAVELFSWKAFKFEKSEPCHMDILKKLVTYACGLPLALELISSSLVGKSIKECRSALDAYKKSPIENVVEKLKVISYDVLNHLQKEIFHDIACCFKGYQLAEVVDILHAHYDVDPEYPIQVLVDKSLIKIKNWIGNGFHDVITLHDLIQDMGREIVRLESPRPGACSRLWLAEDIVNVLQEDKGTSKIQLINLWRDYNDDIIKWDGQAFRKMKKLRTLIIRKGRFSQGPKYLPSSLRVLKWETHPLQEYQPFCFHPKYLAILELSRNCFDSVLLTYLLKKKFESMRVLKFDECGRITKIPNLSSAPKLEVLSFEYCHSLTEIDESVGFLDKLKTLNALGCSQLRNLPPLMLPSLEKLQLNDCISLESFPEILGKMEKMTELFLSGVGIKKFPSSIHNLTGLRSFLMWEGEEIVELPSSILLLEVVKPVRFSCCKGLLLPNEDEGEDKVSSMSFSNKTKLEINECNISEEFFPTLFPRLQSLCLSREKFRIVPECIGEFQFLRSLKLINCEKLEEIRGIPPNIEELFVVNCESLSALTREMLLSKKLHEEGQDKMFILPEPGERLPMWFEYRRRDLSFAFWFRNKFPAISFGLFTWSNPLDQSTIRPRLTINGAKSFQLVAHDYESLDLDAPQGVGHILIFSKTETTFRDQVGEGLSENEWKRAVIAVYDDEPFNEDELECVQVGIHIIKEKSCMDDIRFTDPLSENQCDTLRDVGYSHEAHTQLVQQQTYSARFLEWQCDTVKFRLNSKDRSGYTAYLNNLHVQVPDLKEEQNLTSIDRHLLEGRESFGAGNGKNPLTELLSTTKPEQLVILDLSRTCCNSVQMAELLKKNFENMRVLKFDYCKHITKIPNLSTAPKLEVLSFACCYELTEIDESVGSLDKLKTLDALGCHKLRSLPPLMLPSLKYLNLKDCSSLESFPEILGKMECVTCLSLSYCRIKKLPYSIHNLTGLQSLSLEFCGAVELPNGIMLPGVERLSFTSCGGLVLPIQDEGEEQVSSMPFSNTAHLDIYYCNISEELRIARPMFPRLQFLCLRAENFRILPECIREFQFLRRLILIDCWKLEEIRGIPPNIEELRVSNCRSLSSLTREMLLNKKLYEEGQDKTFILPGSKLPVWFEYQRRESSITFWFRNKFPAISFGALNQSRARFIRAKLTINGKKSFHLVQYHHPHTEMGGDSLICIFSKTQTAFRDQADEALSENEWNRAVFSVDYDVAWWNKHLGCPVEVGVHIIKEKSCMDDIRFSDPLPSTFNDNVNWDSSSEQTSSNITTTLNVQDRAVLNPVESSQASSYVQTQNIQVPCPTSSGAIVCGEEPHLETCCIVFPTTTEESLRNQVEQSQEHVEMESSLDAGGTHVLSYSHDHTPTTATSEDSKGALKIVQDFTTNVPFTYPNPLKNTEDNGLCEVQQLLLLKSDIPTTCEPVEYTEEEEDWLSLPSSLDDVYCRSNSDSDSEPPSLVGSHVEQPLDDAYNNSDSVESTRAIHGTNGLPKKSNVLFLCLLLIVISLFGSAMWHWCFHHNDIRTGTSLKPT